MKVIKSKSWGFESTLNNPPYNKFATAWCLNALVLSALSNLPPENWPWQHSTMFQDSRYSM